MVNLNICFGDFEGFDQYDIMLPEERCNMVKTKIPKLVYNAMFKAVFTDNKVVLARMIESILEYCDINVSIKDKDLVIKSNELSLNNYLDKQFICDYIVKLDEDTELNIEINKATYPGLVQRNMTYSFKIYFDYFKLGDSYKKLSKYTLLQVNFNNYKNPNGKNINRFYMIDTNDINNVLSKNLAIVNVDIADVTGKSIDEIKEIINSIKE